VDTRSINAGIDGAGVSVIAILNQLLVGIIAINLSAGPIYAGEVVEHAVHPDLVTIAVILPVIVVV
jgi:hypothetical protein